MQEKEKEEAVNEENEEIDVVQDDIGSEEIDVVQEEVVNEDLDVQVEAVNEEIDVVVQEETVNEEIDVVVQEETVNEEIDVGEESEIKLEDNLNSKPQTEFQETLSESKMEQPATPQEIADTPIVAEPSDPTPVDYDIAPPTDSNITSDTLEGEEAMDTSMEGIEEGLGAKTADQTPLTQVHQNVPDRSLMDESPTEVAMENEPSMDMTVDVEQVQSALTDSEHTPHHPSGDLGRQDDVTQNTVPAPHEAIDVENITPSQVENPSVLETPVSDVTSRATETSQTQVMSHVQITSDYYSATDSPKEDTLTTEDNDQGLTLSEVAKPSQPEAPTGEVCPVYHTHVLICILSTVFVYPQ